VELSARLALLADWVPQGARLADVGTDHGLLPIWLRLRGRIASAIASDLRPGPLSRARANAAVYGADGIDFRLCDGLAAVEAGECDTVTIAGMGGENIAAILAAAPWTADGRHTLLLQPQSRGETLRAFLADHGYAIRREALAGEMTLSPGRLLCGPCIASDPLGDRYLIEKIIQLQAAAAGLGRSARPEDAAKADAVRDVLTELLELREEWRHANGTGN
jgi:tRNA (adenine22-N1)-methyltransferase